MSRAIDLFKDQKHANTQRSSTIANRPSLNEYERNNIGQFSVISTDFLKTQQFKQHC